MNPNIIRLTVAATLMISALASAQEDVLISIEEGEIVQTIMQSSTRHRRLQMRPLPGGELARHEDDQPPINEPCYTHGEMCSGCK